MTREMTFNKRNAMKRLVKITFAMALSAMLFFSCSKDETINKSQEKVKITLSADKDGIASKTAAIEGETSFSYVWTDEDVENIKLFTVSGSTITEVTDPTITKESDKQITITAEVVPGQTYTFRAILCKPENYTSSGNPKIAAEQSAGTSSFDPNADILVSDDLVVDVAANGNTTADLNLKFRHKVVGNKMTLKNLTAGEKINKVVISSDKDLTGYLSNGSMVGDGKTIAVNYDNVVIPEGGQFPVYFISMANSGQILTVEVTTDKSVYTKTFARTIDLILGQFTRFGVALPEGEKIATINFGNNGTEINSSRVTGQDSQGNTWTITSYGDYDQSSNYSQIATEDNITFTTTLPKSATIKSMAFTLGGIDNDADGRVSLKVGTKTIGSGALYYDDILTISSTSEAEGTVLTVSVTDIEVGVNVYNITVIYE